MAYKSPFLTKRGFFEDPTINITSMVDVFMIILVFLLKSFSSNPVHIQPTPGLRLPVSESLQEGVEALQVEISEHAVQVDNKPISLLLGFRFSSQDLQNNGISTSLANSLRNEKTKQAYISDHNQNVQALPRLLIVADQRTPYKTIKTVVATAVSSGFSDFKLVVAKKE